MSRPAASATARGAPRSTGAPREGSWLYAVVRVLLTPPLRLWFGVHASGTENVPAEGPAIITPNHKSYLDPFFVGVVTPRPVCFMAKAQLFRGPPGRVLRRLGAFPVRRGEADAAALATARAILDAGGLVVVFPEGTRVEDARALGSPHHGAGRLALETGAPIVPAVITSSDHLWLGPFPRPRRVRVTFLPALDPEQVLGHADAVRELVDGELWPGILAEYERRRAEPGLVLTALGAVGAGSGLRARRRARAAPQLLGFVPPRNVRRRAAIRRLRERLR